MLRYTLLFLAACNPSNTRDACNDIANAYCNRIFTLSQQGCANAAQFLADRSYTSLNDCTSALVFHGATCAGTGTSACSPKDYSGSRASDCATGASNMPCDFDFAAGPDGPSCDYICCMHQGDYGEGMECCSGTSHLVENTSCGYTSYSSICD